MLSVLRNTIAPTPNGIQHSPWQQEISIAHVMWTIQRLANQSHMEINKVRLRSIQRQARVQRTFKIIPYLTWFEVYFHLICQSPGRQTSELYALPAAREHAHPDVGAVPAFSYDKFVESSLRITISLN